jgi:hypothetical protein
VCPSGKKHRTIIGRMNKGDKVNRRVGKGRTAMEVARSNVVDSQHNPKQEYAPGYQFPSAVVGDYGLISATGSRPAPGIHTGVGSSARRAWSLSGPHYSRRRRTRSVPRCSNYGTHKHRAASISSSRRGRCAFGRWGVGNIASALAGCLPFVLGPEKTV